MLFVPSDRFICVFAEATRVTCAHISQELGCDNDCMVSVVMLYVCNNSQDRYPDNYESTETTFQ